MQNDKTARAHNARATTGSLIVSCGPHAQQQRVRKQCKLETHLIEHVGEPSSARCHDEHAIRQRWTKKTLRKFCDGQRGAPTSFTPVCQRESLSSCRPREGECVHGAAVVGCSRRARARVFGFLVLAARLACVRERARGGASRVHTAALLHARLGNRTGSVFSHAPCAHAFASA